MADDQKPWDSLTASQKLSQVTQRGVEEAPNSDVVLEMRKNRKVASSRGNSSITLATQRPRDPFFYWQQNNLPYDYNREDDLKKMRDWARLLFNTHPIIGPAIEVMSRYPLTGIELVGKDPKVVEFYEDLFLNDLDWEDYLVAVGQEIWTVGEAFPLGSFNENLGVWEDDELIDPNFVDVIKSPFLLEPRFEMALPETIRTILSEGQPRWEFEALMRSYPELKNFMGDDARMPVSSVLLRHLKFQPKGSPNPRGVPILARAFRSVMQEEMLNAAQDAIADRLYTPLILAKLGATAQELGTNEPWIPSDGDLLAFEASLDAALAADFRVIIHHFGVQVSSVFGKEAMPNLNNDFDRITDRQLQVFGMSKTMLSGAQGGQTYAADALNRDLLSNLLMTHQRKLSKFFKDRALVVAEAQQHFDYEERGGKRYPIFEEVAEIDEETGEERIVEVPKLLVPELRFRAMNMRDEQTQRQFLEELRDKGVPVSMKTRLVNIPIDLKEEYETVKDEQVAQAIEAQNVRKAIFQELTKEGLPIPEDLIADFGAKAMDGGEGASEQLPIPSLGLVEVDTMALAPTPEDLGLENDSPEDDGPATVMELPRNRMRPPESDEMRAGMPRSYQLRTVSKKEQTDEDGNISEVEVESWREVDEDSDGWEREGSKALISGPSHVGLRRTLNLDKEKPLDEQLDEQI